MNKLILMVLIMISAGFATKGLILTTGSMEPTFYGGETVQLIEANTANIGDLVVFKRNDDYVMHRLILEINGCKITKGDSWWVLPDLGCKEIVYVYGGMSNGNNKRN